MNSVFRTPFSVLLSCLLLFVSTACSSAKQESSVPKNLEGEFFVEADGVKLFCTSMGSGDPVLVMHGGPGLDHSYLLPQMEELAKSHRVIFYDQRGCGKSEAELDQASINLENYLADIEAIRTELGYDKISLLGHSWGGALAMFYALSHPEHVEKLVLMNSVPASAYWINEMIRDYYLRTSKYLDNIAAIESSPEFKEGDPQVVSDYYSYIFRTYMADEGDIEELTLTFTTSSALNGFEVNRILGRMIFDDNYDLTGSLRKLSIPTMILHGRQDMVPVGAAQQIQQSIPEAKLVVLDRCGHFPFVESKAEMMTKLTAFLD